MPLNLIIGLPNTGRTEILKGDFEEAARTGRDPILLVPSVEDVFAWERRLTRSREDLDDRGSSMERGAGGFVGGRIMHFNDLCREIVRRSEGVEPRLAGEMRRRLALERAIGKVAGTGDGPAALIDGKTESQPGLLDAALELVDEYRAERIESGDPFGADGTPAGEQPSAAAVSSLREGIEPLVEEYERDLEADGLTDAPRVADRALEVIVEQVKSDRSWDDRPLFVAGFDDLTGQQLELLGKLSNGAGVEIQMAVTWKAGLGHGFLTDRLMSRLTDRLGMERDDWDPARHDSPDVTLFPLAALAEAFITRGPDSQIGANPPVTMIRAAGERKEAEVIGAEIARLLSTGRALPDEIAVAHTDPATSGRLLEGVLRRYEIPTTLETETSALSTSIGASLAALLRASGPEGTADDLILWLRGPLGPAREVVDEIERKCRRRGVGTARGTLDLMPEQEVGEWVSLFEERARGGTEALSLLGKLAREAGRRILLDAASEGSAGSGLPSRPDPEVEIEVRMAETLADSAADLAAADTGGRAGTALLLEAIRRGEISVWTVPAKGTVRITGLWDLRSKRVRYLFVAGLQEGGTRDLSRAGPFLSTAERRGLEMLERVDPEVQARYLLFACLSVPTEAIWLSCTTSDDSGNSTSPSPLLAEITALCPEPLPLIERSGSDVAFPPSSAPTVPELIRSVVVESGDPSVLGLDRALEGRVKEGLRQAEMLEERTRELGGFEDPAIRKDLAAIEAFSPSELEAWLACPWSWLIDRKINPRPFRPDATYLVSGTFVHEVLERLYREAPNPAPGAGDVEEWISRVPEVCEEILAGEPDSPLSGDEPAVRLARFTLERMVSDFLRREAESAGGMFSPTLFEQRFASFDQDEDPDPDALGEVDMDGWRLRGTVDRIDTRGGVEPAEGVEALVIDYKTGAVDAAYSSAKVDDRGKVQIPLYMEAVRRSLGLVPAAGFVLPLKEGSDPRPRGAIPTHQPSVVGDRGYFENDLVESIPDFIGKVLDLADDAVSAIREGDIDHSPEECRKHFEDPDGMLPDPTSLAALDVVIEPVAGEPLASIGVDTGESPPFSTEQEVAIRSRATEVMVSAAAGSGKTAVTVERYRRLLEGDPETGREPLDPDQILVFTFTDKAAAKLREEVRETRSKDAGEPVSMSDAWVGTFHSICSRILTAYPLEAGVDPGYTVIDDITSATLRDQAFDRALRGRLEGSEDKDQGAPASRMVVLAQMKQVTLKKSVLATFDRLRARGIELPGLDLPPGPPGYPADDLEELARRIGAALDRTDISRFDDSQRDKCRRLKALIEGAGGRTIRASEINAESFNNKKLDEETDIPSLRERIEKRLVEFEGYPWLVEFDQLLRRFGQEYAGLKEGRSALDYEDLQIKTLNLLTENREIQAEYEARFEEIMVDEFQDTNQLQMKLIEALRGGGSTRLMTVGDEMQAIYGFRHADVGIFRDRTSRLRSDRGDSELVELPRNYRSEPPVIESVNAIGRNIHGAAGDSPSFTPLVAGRDAGDEGPATTLLLTPEKGWDEVDLGQLSPEGSGHTENQRAAAAEALSVASHLRDLVDAGRYSQGDVAILLRATTDLKTFQNALTLFGLRSVVPSSRGFWSSRPVLQLIALLAVVANPLDDRALTSVLTSPACGLGPDGLWRVRETAGSGKPLWNGVVELASVRDGSLPPEPGPKGDLIAISRLHRAVSDARSQLDRSSLESVVSNLLDSSGLDLANLVRDRASLASLERIATLAGEFEGQEGRDLRGFLDWAESSREADAEAAVSASSEKDDAIKIMTVHKAKGLEFPVVCVPDLGRQLGRPLEGPVVIGFDGEDETMQVGLRLPNTDQKVFGWPEIESVADRETEAEELRLVHVAMTRAEEKLILSGRVKAPGGGNPHRLPATNRILEPFGLDYGKPDTWAESIASSDQADHLLVEMNLPSDERNRKRLVRTFPLVIKTREIETASPPLDRPERAFFPDVPLSFSGLLEFRECPARFFARRVLRMDIASAGTPWAGPEATVLVERDGGTRFGTAVHELFERSAMDGWKAPSAEEIEAALKASGSRDSGDEGAARAGKMIDGFLNSELGVRVKAAGAQAAAEVPIVLGIGGLTIRGFIDLLIEEDGSLTVVDYKTNRLDGREPEELMESYELQRDLYSLVVARARDVERIESAFVFLEQPGAPVLKTYGPDDLDEVEDQLRSEVVEPIIDARYFGGGAGPQPCGDCEACRLLDLSSH